MSDTIRVLRLIEYRGSRERVEATVSRAIHGSRYVNRDLCITAYTLSEFPDILTRIDKSVAEVLAELRPVGLEAKE